MRKRTFFIIAHFTVVLIAEVATLPVFGEIAITAGLRSFGDLHRTVAGGAVAALVAALPAPGTGAAAAAAGVTRAAGADTVAELFTRGVFLTAADRPQRGGV